MIMLVVGHIYPVTLLYMGCIRREILNAIEKQMYTLFLAGLDSYLSTLCMDNLATEEL